MLKTYP